MTPQSPQSGSGPDGSGSGSGPRIAGDQGWPKWTIWVLVAAVAALFLLPGLVSRGAAANNISYGVNSGYIPIEHTVTRPGTYSNTYCWYEVKDGGNTVTTDPSGSTEIELPGDWTNP